MKTAIVNHRQFVYTPLPAAEMQRIADSVLAAEKARIQAGRNTKGGAAGTLTEAYARRKVRRGARPIRDLMFTGRTMAALQVTAATQSRIAIGTSDPAVQVILNAANKREEQLTGADVFGLSRAGVRAQERALQKALDQNDVIKVVG